MGKGIAQAFKKRFPDMFEDYARRCEQDLVKPGVPYLYENMLGTSIINFPTKKHWRSPSRLADIERGLDIVLEEYRDWGIESIAFPPLGCGNGGLDWEVVGPIMYQKLSKLGIPVEIYAPFGTSQKQLTDDFLGRNVSHYGAIKGHQHKKLSAGWVAVLDVLAQLEKQPYANPVGRTIFQKICYMITEQGVETGFNFRQGSYGPFAPEIKEALSVFANANLIQEQPLGRMTALHTGSEYQTVRKKFEDQLAPLQKKIDRTVDLFSRIKSTHQAEEVTTVLYAARKLKKVRKTQPVSEQELYDYVLDWKRAWNSDEKRTAIASSIRNLEILGWIHLQYSESFPETGEFA